jgi:biotin carboxyl carrier protein
MDGKDFKAIVDDLGEFMINSAELAQFDLARLSDDEIHIIHGGNAIKAHILEVDFEKKRYLIRLKGKKFQVTIADEYDQLVKKMGLSEFASRKVADVMAPMPGLVLEVLVDDGDEVEEGTPLIILEAMKMENVIKATGSGVVKKVIVEKEAAVEKGQLLIELE